MGLRDGDNNIGWFSTTGHLCFGFDTKNGALTEQGHLTSDGKLQVKGVATRSGISGSFGGNTYNFNWTGSLAAYVDASNIGTVQMNSSDRRIKDKIEPFICDNLCRSVPRVQAR
jgi:hypothetical protein